MGAETLLLGSRVEWVGWVSLAMPGPGSLQRRRPPRAPPGSGQWLQEGAQGSVMVGSTVTFNYKVSGSPEWGVLCQGTPSLPRPLRCSSTWGPCDMINGVSWLFPSSP